MQIHQIKSKNKRKKRKRIGRGGKRGAYSGKGLKGQKSRAGRTSHPIIRESIKKYPKLKGYRFNPVSAKKTVVNVSILDRFFDNGSVVSPKTLLEKRLIRRIKGRAPKVKILGKGELSKKLIIKNCEMSESAKRKIANVK
ncbi:50S ribosomal protein L15 [Parcubacteria bacterium DG_72]|nr:MAG: 50S ribosomal protein L15 [Parcubacteria bacterium DG_72]